MGGEQSNQPAVDDAQIETSDVVIVPVKLDLGPRFAFANIEGHDVPGWSKAVARMNYELYNTDRVMKDFSKMGVFAKNKDLAWLIEDAHLEAYTQTEVQYLEAVWAKRLTITLDFSVDSAEEK